VHATASTVNKTSRDTSYWAARARVSPPSLRVINWRRRLGLGRRWPPNKSETCSCSRRKPPGAETGPAPRPPITRRVLAYIIISSSSPSPPYTKNWFCAADTVCAVAFVPPPTRRGFGWRRVAKKKKPGPEPEPRPDSAGRWGRARSAVRRAGRAGPSMMISSFIYLPFAFGPIRYITCCSCRTLLVFGYHLVARAPSSSSSPLPSTTEPTTACSFRWSSQSWPA